VPLRVLSSADDLLRICVRALRRPTASVVWVADVLALLEKASEVVDWDVFVEECRARRYATEAVTALEYVRVTFGAKVPEARARAPARARIGSRAMKVPAAERFVAHGVALAVTSNSEALLHQARPFFAAAPLTAHWRGVCGASSSCRRRQRQAGTRCSRSAPGAVPSSPRLMCARC